MSATVSGSERAFSASYAAMPRELGRKRGIADRTGLAALVRQVKMTRRDLSPANFISLHSAALAPTM
jgi:hypothetical protein